MRPMGQKSGKQVVKIEIHNWALEKSYVTDYTIAEENT